MKIIYTKHLREEIKLRRISKEKVEACIQNPDLIQPAKAGKKAYLKDLGTNYLKVIVSQETDSNVAITAYWIAKSRVKS